MEVVAMPAGSVQEGTFQSGTTIVDNSFARATSGFNDATEMSPEEASYHMEQMQAQQDLNLVEEQAAQDEALLELDAEAEAETVWDSFAWGFDAMLAVGAVALATELALALDREATDLQRIQSIHQQVPAIGPPKSVLTIEPPKPLPVVDPIISMTSDEFPFFSFFPVSRTRRRR